MCSLAGALFAALVVLLEQLAPVGVTLRIGFDGAVAALVLLFAVGLTVERMAAVHRVPALLAQPLRLLRLGLEDAGGADPRSVHDLPHPLPCDPELPPGLLQIVQLLIARNNLVRIGLTTGHEIVVFCHVSVSPAS